jgi:hypothetical protein
VDGGHDRRRAAVPVPVTDPDNPRLANFRDLRAGDRRPVTALGSIPVIVEGVPAVQRLLASLTCKDRASYTLKRNSTTSPSCMT